MNIRANEYSLFLGLVGLVGAGCGGLVTDETQGTGTGGGIAIDEVWPAQAPSVAGTTPLDGATGVPTNGSATAIFDEAMDCSSLTDQTFLLTVDASAVPVAGTVICLRNRATFWPKVQLDAHRTWRATITTGARSKGGRALDVDQVWRFTTGTHFDAGMAVRLGAANSYAIFSEGGVSTEPGARILGDVAVSPATSHSLEGFALDESASHSYATSATVVGRVFASDFTDPTPSMLAGAALDMGFGFADARARAADATELDGGHLGATTIRPGVYRFGSDLQIDEDVGLTGDETDVWVFQVARDLVVSGGAKVRLVGGGLASNVFWQVDGRADLEPSSHIEGTVMARGEVRLGNGSSVNGRLLTGATAELGAAALVIEPTIPAWAATGLPF